MELSVIFTTYNSPLWLEKVLWGYQYQKFKDFEIIIADDGSTSDTADLIKKVKRTTDLTIKHIWQEDKGFRKCKILNEAISEAESDYLVFSDGDCIPRYDFLKAHLAKRKEGYYLSGGYFKLPMNISKIITEYDIASGRSFDVNWLKKKGLPAGSFKSSKLILKGVSANLLNTFTTTNDSWNGHNSSAWKKDILAVNAFDERMRYGSEDREFGERLMNSGIKSRQIRYSAICIHLDHSRNYVNQNDLNQNALIRKETKEKRKVWTDFGIEKNVHSHRFVKIK